jgi:hypothetical protein
MAEHSEADDGEAVLDGRDAVEIGKHPGDEDMWTSIL